MDKVEVLQVPLGRVHEVATFCTMYNGKPVRKYKFSSPAIPCMLQRSDTIQIEGHSEKARKKVRGIIPDELFTLTVVERLGSM